jgi:hypothetical protein
MKTGFYICKNCGMLFEVKDGKNEEKCIYYGHICTNCSPDSYKED